VNDKSLLFTNYSVDADVESEAFIFLRKTVAEATNYYLSQTGDATVDFSVTYGVDKAKAGSTSRRDKRSEDLTPEEDKKRRAEQFKAVEPAYPDLFVLPRMTEETIEDAIQMFQHYEQIFERWNLGSIAPYPCVALNFHGPSGTGKTLAAQVFCKRLGKKIILASYAQIASMYVGEGAKNLEALFEAAEKQDAVLFLDEADSLLSKRIQGETSGAEAGINAMRGQLLICLEKFKGVVIFASNLIANYDKAFETRIISVEFAKPEKELRAKIWEKHLPKELPRDETVTFEALAEFEDICGRDVRNATLSVARKMANRGLERATLEMFKEAIDFIVGSRFENLNGGGKFTKEEAKVIGEVVKKNRALQESERTAFEQIKDGVDSLIAARLERKGVSTEEAESESDNKTSDANDEPEAEK